MGLIFFLRHAQTHPVMTTPPNRWKLSEIGSKNAIQLVPNLIKNLNEFHCLDNLSLWSSTESKSFDTLLPLSDALNLSIEKDPIFNELHSNYLPEKNRTIYLEKKRKLFTDFARDTTNLQQNPISDIYTPLKKFDNRIEVLQTKFSHLNHLICSHGTILTMFASVKLNINSHPDVMYNKWLNLPFCAFAVLSPNQFFRDFTPFL